MKRLMMPMISTAAMLSSMPAGAMYAPQMDAGNVAQLLAEVKAELTRVDSSVKQVAEDALAEHKKNGELSAQAKADADKALSQYHDLNAAVEKLTGKLEGLETRNLDLEQAFAQGGAGGRGGAISVGQEIAESDQLKAWLDGGLQGSLTLRPENAITVVPGGLIREGFDSDPANLPMQRMAIRALLNVTTTESDVVKFARQTVRTNNAGMVAEGAAADPASVYTWAQAEANVRKIVAFAHASDESLADAGQLQGMIDNELRYDLNLEEEQQILSGDGTGQNLQGLLTVASAFVAAGGLPNETRIDRLRLGILQVALGNYSANGVTLHPVDWAGIELTKDNEKRYIFGNPNEQSTPRLWGLDVVPTLSHGLSEWMVGNFRMAATLHDRQDTEVLISSEHGTNFIEGMKTIKATKRLALANKRPGALVTGDFAFA